MAHMKSQHKILKPAEFIIQYFGGLRPTARAIGRSHASVNKWRRPKKEGGTDGYIPSAAMHEILDIAERKGFEITAYDLMVGRIIND